MAEAKPLTHVEALELEEVPEHLLVIGSGYVGIEFAQAMRRFGSEVSVIGRERRLMPREDSDVDEALYRLFEDEGIELVLNAKIKRVAGRSGESVSVVYEQDGAETTLKGSHVLVALGRTPNTEGIGLDVAGVELTDRGYIKVNERLQTTAPGVWAIGEVAGSPQFTHISMDDFRVVHSSLTGGKRVTTGRQVPYCLFTDPELARVGLSEMEAAAQGISYRLFKMGMEGDLRAHALGEMRGFMKALVGVGDDRILGFTMFGADADEVMATVQVAIIGGLPYTALRDAVLTHPTLVEGLVLLFSSAPTRVDAAGVATAAA
jgi:pyruvate/2-oxoglutarate dehydrogenase complex dihydrolipoamide dehydrogenase (E3) component